MPKLPETKQFRVAIAGAVYDRFVERTGINNEDEIVPVRELALFGQTIDLTDREARRLTDLGAVKPADEPLSYDEMDDKQLAAAVSGRGLVVRSSGADPDRPLRTDLINALVIYDQGQGVAGQPPAAQAAPPPPPDPATGEAPPEDLSKASREQLNTLAESLGVDKPDELANKGEVVNAIEAKRAEAAGQ